MSWSSARARLRRSSPQTETPSTAAVKGAACHLSEELFGCLCSGGRLPSAHGKDRDPLRRTSTPQVSSSYHRVRWSGLQPYLSFGQDEPIFQSSALPPREPCRPRPTVLKSGEMRLRYLLPLALTAFAATVPVIKWKTGDRSRPLPVMVTPGEPSTPEHAGTAPSDAVQLFNGKDLAAWQQRDGKPPPRKCRRGGGPRRADGPHGLYETPALQSDARQAAAPVAGSRTARALS